MGMRTEWAVIQPGDEPEVITEHEDQYGSTLDDGHVAFALDGGGIVVEGTPAALIAWARKLEAEVSKHTTGGRR